MVPEPHLRLATPLDRIARRVDRIEQRLIPVEIGTVDRLSESNHPTRFASVTADPELHDRHSQCSSGGLAATGGVCAAFLAAQL